MNRLLLCLYDVKAETYNAPFTVPTLGVAYRNLADEVARKGDSSNVLAAHPEDYVCVQVGTFDDESGVVSAFPTPKLMFNVSDLKVGD